MNKLMILEWKKLKQKSIIVEVIIYWVILMFMPMFLIKQVSADFGQSFDTTFTLIQSVQLGFVLFGVSLINQVFIDEYKNKTITLSFGYPISRKKLFKAKVLFISLFVFFATIISFILTGVATYLLDQLFSIIKWQLTVSELAVYLGRMIIGSIIATLIGFIPLFFFAIWKRATIPSVICAIIAMQLPNFSSFFQLEPNFVMIVLCILGAISIYLSIKTAEKIGEV